MQTTTLAYMDDQHCTTGTSTVLAVTDDAKDGMACVVLDATCFYPQGGGQAWDTGSMTAPGARFAVQEVRFVDGYVHHYGRFEEARFAVGTSISYAIDAERRTMNARLHSAGHLLDEAVKNLGYGWAPTKGIHYPGQAAVEYTGAVEDCEAARQSIEAEANRLISTGHPVSAALVSAEALPTVSSFVPPNLPENKPIRVVTMWGDKGTPCGGTHVKDITDIGTMAVRYVKAKKGQIKVAYELEGCA
ncbi:MAG: hypothetical protein JO126_03990 [Alphaproteobacteria bacterium]|nr:hypothetical protein [Alphaproteobacteria bacterium]